MNKEISGVHISKDGNYKEHLTRLGERLVRILRERLTSSIVLGKVIPLIGPPFEAPPELRRQGLPDSPGQYIVRLPIWWDTPSGMFEMPLDITKEKLESIGNGEIDNLVKSLTNQFNRTNHKPRPI